MPASAKIMALVGRIFTAYGLQPAIDGWVLPRSLPDAIATEQQNGTELLVGSTANEGIQLNLRQPRPRLCAQRSAVVGTRQAEPIAALYTGTDPDTA